MITNNFRAAGILTFSMLAFAVEDALIKLLTTELPMSQVLGMISIAGIFVFGGIILVRVIPFWTRDLLAPAVVLRNVAEAVATVAIVLALALTDLSSTAAIVQATPLFITLGAVVWLKEPVAWRRRVAIAFGFIGVLFVIRPGLDGFQLTSLWALVAAIGYAARDLCTRRVPEKMETIHLATAAFVALLIASIVMAVVFGEVPVLPDGEQAVLAIGCGATTVLGYALLVTATRMGDATILAPVRYTRLVFALIFAFVVFGERPDAFTIAGAIIIVVAGCYTIWREARLGRLQPLTPVGAIPAVPTDQPLPPRSASDAADAPKARKSTSEEFHARQALHQWPMDRGRVG